MALPFGEFSSLIKRFGLPCIIGVAAIDPGNLEVDLQAGAAFGYSLIWSVLVASILGCILQTLAAHLTIYTGLHLAEVCALVYRRNALLSRLVFFITLFSVISFDVAEVIGTAFATRMLFGIPLWLGMIISVCDTLLVLFLQRKGMTRIELIIEGLLFILAGCLIYEFILSKPSFLSIAKGAVIPSFGDNRTSGVLLAISIMGSVIMSHNLFLHSWLEKERRKPLQSTEVDRSSTTISTTATESQNQDEEQAQQQSTNSLAVPNMFNRLGKPVSEFYDACRYSVIESSAIYFSTFLINTCVLVIAATLPHELLSNIDNFGLKDAGALLQRALGQQFASTAWGIALLASGHAATVTGVLASQAVCEGFLNIHSGSSSSRLVLGSRLIAILPALVVALMAGEEGSDALAVASQAVLSFSLPFAAIPLFKVLHGIGKVKQLYSRFLFGAGLFVFCVVMIANGFAVREFGEILYGYGWLAFTIFVLFTSGIGVVLVILVRTDVDILDLDLGSGIDSPDESTRLFSGK